MVLEKVDFAAILSLIGVSFTIGYLFCTGQKIAAIKRNHDKKAKLEEKKLKKLRWMKRI